VTQINLICDYFELREFLFMAVHLPLKALFLAVSATFLLAACNNSDNEYDPTAKASDSPAVKAMANAEPDMEIGSDESGASSEPSGTGPRAVVEHYADLAHANYEDVLETAWALRLAIMPSNSSSGART
jgi:putative iron-regulated protein